MKQKHSITSKLVSIMLYIVNLVAVFYPWIIIGNKKYNFLQLKSEVEAMVNRRIHQTDLVEDDHALAEIEKSYIKGFWNIDAIDWCDL
ncbi:MAG: hypothetical protein SOU03_06320 [Dorea sp.]|nr:hypothetical protein [Dorea sp.]